MKYIRLYENFNYKVGDYVLINVSTDDIAARYNEEYLEFIGKCIGRIVRIINIVEQYLDDEIEVEFDRPWVPPAAWNISQRSTLPDKNIFKSSDIEFCSSNREEVQCRLDAKKYNL